MKLGEKLKHLREAKGWTKKDAAKVVAVPYTTYQKYEDRKQHSKPVGMKGEKLARAFGVTTEYLFNDAKDYPPCPQDHIRVGEILVDLKTDVRATGKMLVPPNRINIIGVVSAGETDIAYDDAGLPVGGSIEEPIERPYDVKDANAYGLVIEGNSMLPGYPKGTKVVVCPSETVKTGDIVICRLRSTGKVYIKEVKFQGDTVILSSHNATSYAPMAAPYKDVLFCHKVVWLRRP